MCHARHHPPARVARVGTAPPDVRAAPPDPALRVSDAERDALVAELREHGAAGRLSIDELDERVGAAYAARTRGDLDALRADLPAAPRRPAPPRRRPRGRGRAGHEWRLFIQVNVLLVAIWAATGADSFWPGWVAGWWALAIVLKTAPGLLRLR